MVWRTLEKRTPLQQLLYQEQYPIDESVSEIIVVVHNSTDLGNNLRPYSANFLLARGAGKDFAISMIRRSRVETYWCFDAIWRTRSTAGHTTRSAPNYGPVCDCFGAKMQAKLSKRPLGKKISYVESLARVIWHPWDSYCFLNSCRRYGLSPNPPTKIMCWGTHG
jgi:hypothetical protein